MGYSGGYMLPAPDGTIDQGDRQSLANVYSGILSGLLIILDLPCGFAITLLSGDVVALVTPDSVEAVCN